MKKMRVAQTADYTDCLLQRSRICDLQVCVAVFHGGSHLYLPLDLCLFKVRGVA